MSHTIIQIPITVEFKTSPSTWELLADENRGTGVKGRFEPLLRLFETRNWSAQGKALDAWQVRTDFLTITSDSELLRFLNATGLFSQKYPRGFWGYEDFKEWQHILRELLRRRPAAWKSVFSGVDKHKVNLLWKHATLGVQFWWKGDAHYAVLPTSDSLSAMLATIQLDHVRNAKFIFCARKDCRKPFEVKTGHPRKFCSPYCGHLEAVRAMRARQKKEKEPSH